MIIINEGITLSSESLYLDLVNIQVAGCRYRQTLELVASSRPFVSLSLFWGGGGGPKGILFSLYWNKEASFKGIYTLNVAHI